MISWSDYTTAVDVWAVGCILAEMILGRQLFTAEDEDNMVAFHLSMLGDQGKADFQKLLGIDGEELQNYLNSNNIPQSKTLKELLYDHSP